ncbi:MAG: YabP/YqfC family sporulation protein [Clostridia bacterium]|nr:YabP/YqfC family sporulation protein [Clostridia bacterium]
MQEQNVKKSQLHHLTIDQRKTISVSGVESVNAFSPSRIALTLTDGTKLFIAGVDLKITAFSKESGDFQAVGGILGASYGGKGFVAKIFK